MSVWTAGGDHRWVRDPRPGEPVPAKPVLPHHRYHAVLLDDVIIDGIPAWAVIDISQPGRRVADYLTREQAWAVWLALERLETGG